MIYGKRIGWLNGLVFFIGGVSLLAILGITQTERGPDTSQRLNSKDRLAAEFRERGRQAPQERFNKGRAIQPDQRELLRAHTDQFGRVRPDLWAAGIEQLRKTAFAPGYWTQVGPAPLISDNDKVRAFSGLVTDIAIDSSRIANGNIIYIATTGGGIWKSTDRGKNWKAKTDFMPSLSIGAVALDPSNPLIVYAGTSHCCGMLANRGFFFRKAAGIYRSRDGGETWDILNPGNIFTQATLQKPDSGVEIRRIVVPAPNVLLVATNVGLFRSTDGGKKFVEVLFPYFSKTLISDLKVDTAVPSTVYVAVEGQGIFRITDAGGAFVSGQIFDPKIASNGTIGTYFEIRFAQSRFPDANTLYATVEVPGTTNPSCPDKVMRLFKSTDRSRDRDGGGVLTWASSDASGLGEPQGFQCGGYDETIGVDPQHPNILYIGLINFFRSKDGGRSFEDKTGAAHADYHAIAFGPEPRFGGERPVYVGNDGGIATSVDRGDSFKNINNGTATLQFYQIDIGRGSRDNNRFTYGGMQDNSVGVQESGVRPWIQGTIVDSRGTRTTVGGDGGGVAVDPSDPRRAYTALNGAMFTTSDGGVNWSHSKGNDGKFRFAVDPKLGRVVYATSDSSTDGNCTGGGCFFQPGSQLFKSIDYGVTFKPFRTFYKILNGVESKVPNAIHSIATVATDPNTLWVGLADGTVQSTSYATLQEHPPWVPQTVPGAPLGQPVSALAIDLWNTAQAVVVYRGFTGFSPTAHVFRTTNFGYNWSNISGNLPDLPLYSVVIDPGTSPHTIIVASDAAVLRTANLGATWEVLGTGLPMVDCTSLALDSSVTPSLLRVGTYGRSVFELTTEATRRAR